MAENVMVVLKRSENSGFGFSLLGTTGLPHVIYDIVENSPAAECGEVEAGDIIVKVNGTDVHRYTTKEVLKCLRLSKDSVTLELRRDPVIKARIKERLAHSSNLHHSDIGYVDIYDIRSSPKSNGNSSSDSSSKSSNSNLQRKNLTDSPCRKSRIPTAVKSPAKGVATSQCSSKRINSLSTTRSNGSGSVVTNSGTSGQPSTSIPGKARFEAYMMTGDLILNLSRTPQSSNLIASHVKKVDTLYDSSQKFHPNGALAPRASGESTPSSSPPNSDESDHSIRESYVQKTEDDNKRKDLEKNLARDRQCDSNSDSMLHKKTEKYLEEVSDAKEHLETCQSDGLGGFMSSSSSQIKKRSIQFDGASIDNIDFSRNEQNLQQSSSSSSPTVKSEAISSTETSFSVPASPVSLSTPLIECKDITNSAPTSPEQSLPEVVRRQQNGVVRKCDAAGFRTSKSEDHLQQVQRDGLGAVIPIDIDEDINSSLNTLLDTQQDSDESPTNGDRIVWTYNAPVSHRQNLSSNSHSSSISSSPQRSDSPASPTSVSSSVMSSNSESKGNITANVMHNPIGFLSCPANGDQSVSEAISNISSPDYQDDDNLLSSRDLTGMALSDPSDSDSTILVSDAVQKRRTRSEHDYKVVIQVKGKECQIGQNEGYSELKNSEDELVTITENHQSLLAGSGVDKKDASPPVSDDGSDVDSLHSYHYSPKAVDMPSAIRLAKRLYSLDGFKKSDVSRHLSKNNDFSRAVADEYLKFFDFTKQTLDESLRYFLQQFALSGETQERERVLIHFSKRYLDCNPSSLNSQDAVHTLTCAIMLLNTDLHGPNIGRKMTCSEFIDNLVELNDGENFPKDVLKHLYQAIKNHPLEWALDEDFNDQRKLSNENNLSSAQIGSNPFLDAPTNTAAIEYKKGYVMRKCCYDSNYKKTPFGKRSWKMFYCTLRDLVLYLHKDEHGFRKNQMSDNVHNAIRIHHALATKATDYVKKQHVFRLQTADQSEYLFQTSDSKELSSWIDTINYVCAAFSAPPLEGGVGSQKRFQRPLLPSTHTRLRMRDQVAFYEQQVAQLENAFAEHKQAPIPSKGLPLQNHREKEAYLQFELKRSKIYVNALNSRIAADQQLEIQNSIQNPEDRLQIHHNIIGNIQGQTNLENNVAQVQGQTMQQTVRYNYKAPSGRNESQQDLG